MALLARENPVLLNCEYSERDPCECTVIVLVLLALHRGGMLCLMNPFLT